MRVCYVQVSRYTTVASCLFSHKSLYYIVYPFLFLHEYKMPPAPLYFNENKSRKTLSYSWGIYGIWSLVVVKPKSLHCNSCSMKAEMKIIQKYLCLCNPLVEPVAHSFPFLIPGYHPQLHKHHLHPHCLSLRPQPA